MIEISSIASSLSEGEGKLSKSGGKISGSFFSTKNSSVDFCFAPVKPRFTLPQVSAQDVTKKIRRLLPPINVIKKTPTRKFLNILTKFKRKVRPSSGINYIKKNPNKNKYS